MKKTIKFILKCFIIAFALVLVFNCFGTTTYARINESYTDDATLQVPEDEVVKASVLTDYIGSFIYAIGVVVEWLVTSLMGVFSGQAVFPWADKIIFNAIPLLDVNFINPDSASLLGNSQWGLGDVIRNIYFTGMSMALGFLGIIVAVMAIKLAISTIASEKAKYKEAIVSWLTSLVLLFGIHFGLAFAFYMNEELVEVASSIVKNATTKYGAEITAAFNKILNANKDKIVENFIKKAKREDWKEWINGLNPVRWITKGFQKSLNKYILDIDGDPADILNDNIDITFALLNNTNVKKGMLDWVEGNNESGGFLGWLKHAANNVNEFFGGASVEEAQMATLAYMVKFASRTDISAAQFEQFKNEFLKAASDKDMDEHERQIQKAWAYACELGAKRASGKSIDVEASPNIVSNVGMYFKYNAWYTDIERGGWSPTNVSIVSATLYTILVFQSVMFLFAYLKRFFYVTVLSVIAPFVVIYDFFKKSVAI